MTTKLLSKLTAGLCAVFFLAFSSPVLAADYYWVNGQGFWEDYANHWAQDSLGTSFWHQAPSSADNVYFTGHSFPSTNQKVYISNSNVYCKDMDWTGSGGKSPILKDTLEASNLNIYGSLNLTSGMNLAYTKNYVFKSNGVETIRSAGNNFTGPIYFDRLGGEWSLLDSLSVSYFYPGNVSINLLRGTFRTNDQAIRCKIFISDNANTRAIHLGASTITLDGSVRVNGQYVWDMEKQTGLTFDAGTSTLVFTSNSISDPNRRPSLAANSQTFHNVRFTGPDCDGLIRGDSLTFNHVTFLGPASILGNHSFDTLTLTPGMVYYLEKDMTQTITGDLEARGNCAARISIQCPVAGGPAYLKKASGTVNLDFCSLQDLTAIGGADWVATNSDDLGDNNGFVFGFTLPQRLYWVGDGGRWNDGNHWSTSSGGPPSGCVPGPNTDVFFDANSFSMPGETVTFAPFFGQCKNMDWTGVQHEPKFKADRYAKRLEVFGSLRLAANLEWDFLGHLVFESNAGGNTIFSAGHTIQEMQFHGLGGEWTLEDNLNGGYVRVYAGDFRTDDFDMVLDGMDFRRYLTRGVYLGASTVTIEGNYLFDHPREAPSGPDSTLTFDAGTSHLIFTHPSGNLGYHLSPGLVFHDVTFTDPFNEPIIYGANTFHELTLLGNARTASNNTIETLNLTPGKRISLSKTQRLTNLNAIGNCTALINIQSGSLGNTAFMEGPVGDTIRTEYLLLQDIHASGATFVADSSYDAGGNAGWQISAGGGQNYHWIGRTGNWSDPANWSLVSGDPNASNGCLPGPGDHVFFDSLSFQGPGNVVTVDVANAFCKNMCWLGATGHPILTSTSNQSILRVWGSIELITDMDQDFQGSLWFEARDTANTLKMAGKVWHRDIVFKGEGGGWTLLDSLKSDKVYRTPFGIHLMWGALNTNGQYVEAYGFICKGNLPRSLELGSSHVKMTGHFAGTYGGPFLIIGNNLSFDAGTSTIELAYSTNHGGRVPRIIASNQTFHNVIFSAPNGIGEVNGTNTYHHVSFKGRGWLNGFGTFDTLEFTPGKSYRFNPSGLQTISPNGQLLASGTPSQLTRFYSFVPGTRTTIHKDGGDICLNYTYMVDQTTSGTAKFFAGPNSDNQQNNLGWSFSDCNVPFLEGCTGAAVLFDDYNLSIGAWDWDFDDPASGLLNSSNLPAPTHVFDSAGTYQSQVDVLLTNTSNRLYTDVLIHATPAAEISASDSTALCPGDSVGLTVSPTSNFQWSTGALDSSITVLDSGTYVVSVTDPLTGCVGRDSVEVIQLPAPNFTASLDPNSNYCVDGHATVDVPVGGTYVWSTGDSTASIQVTGPGTYQLDYADSYGCPGATAITLGLEPFYCCGDFSVNLNQCHSVYPGYGPQECAELITSVSGGRTPYSYQWSTGDSASQITVCPDSTTDYFVTVTDASGCQYVSYAGEMTVHAIDVHCGPNNSMVSLCHYDPANVNPPQQLCLSTADVAGHLAAYPADHLGPCGMTDPCSFSAKIGGQIATESLEASLIAAPNPFSGKTRISFSLPHSDQVTLSLYDLQGRQVKVLYAGEVRGGEKKEIQVDGTALPEGLYLLQLRSPRVSKHLSVVLSR